MQLTAGLAKAVMDNWNCSLQGVFLSTLSIFESGEVHLKGFTTAQHGSNSKSVFSFPKG